MGIVLRSRPKGTDIILLISNEIKRKLVKSIAAGYKKISVIIGESTSVSKKSAIIIYLRTHYFPDVANSKAFSFPLALIELESLLQAIELAVGDAFKTSNQVNHVNHAVVLLLQ